jgi:hypothetical protein
LQCCRNVQAFTDEEADEDSFNATAAFLFPLNILSPLSALFRFNATTAFLLLIPVSMPTTAFLLQLEGLLSEAQKARFNATTAFLLLEPRREAFRSP